MTKLLLGLLGAGVIATGGYAAASGIETDPARTVSLPSATTGTTTGTTTATTMGTTDGGAAHHGRGDHQQAGGRLRSM